MVIICLRIKVEILLKFDTLILIHKRNVDVIGKVLNVKLKNLGAR